MEFLVAWLTFGFFGWLSLCTFRYLADQLPTRNVSSMDITRGFLFSLVLGPICFIYLAHLIGRKLNG